MLIDFAKAFSKILHSGVIDQLIKFNLSVIAWVFNFLTDRFQRMKIGEMERSWKAVASGVPQNILCCVFIDSLHFLISNSITCKYAADVHIVHFVRHPEEDKFQLEDDDVLEWSHCPRLPINDAKCCVLDIILKKADKRV